MGSRPWDADQQALAPLLFVDETPPAHPNPVAPATRSQRALRKDRTQRTLDGFPVHSFRTLLATLGTLVKNRVIPHGGDQRAVSALLSLLGRRQTNEYDVYVRHMAAKALLTGKRTTM